MTEQQAEVGDNKLHLPPPSALPGMDIKLPYAIVGDNAFALDNYRLSRARRCSEMLSVSWLHGFGCSSITYTPIQKTLRYSSRQEYVSTTSCVNVVADPTCHLGQWTQKTPTNRWCQATGGRYQKQSIISSQRELGTVPTWPRPIGWSWPTTWSVMKELCLGRSMP